jgi:hypothetical protein
VTYPLLVVEVHDGMPGSWRLGVDNDH